MLVDLTSNIMDIQFVRDFIFNKARSTVMGQTKGLYPAPLKILDVKKLPCLLLNF